MSIFHKDHKSGESETRFKFLSDSVLKAFETDRRKYLCLTAFSNAEDVVDDVMSQTIRSILDLGCIEPHKFWIRIVQNPRSAIEKGLSRANGVNHTG